MKKYILEFKYQFAFLTFLLVLVSGLEVLSAVIMANIINAIAIRNINDFMQAIFIWLSIWLGIVVIRYLLSILETNFEQGIANKIRSDLVDAINNENYENYNSQDNARFVSWMNNDTQQIVDRSLTYLYVVIETISSIILSLITLWKYNLWLMLASVVLALITLYLPKVLDKKLAIASSELTQENENFVKTASDMLSNFNLLFSFNALSLMKKNITSKADNLKNAYVKQAKVYGGIAVLGFIGNIISQIGLTGFSGVLVMKGMITIGAIYSISSLSGSIFNGVGNLPNYLSYVKSSNPIFEKFEKFIATNPNPDEENTKRKLIANQPFLAMEDVSFHYPHAKENVINHFSYKFEKNKKYFLAGDSGCGKSTILKLLAGFYPSYSGKIILQGQQLKDYSSTQLHNKIFYLDQHAQVIKGTVRENLNLTDHYPDQQLKEVLAKMHLDHSDVFLNKIVEKGGSSLSGGQLQRLALARALLRSPKIFLLDEGTTGVEAKTATELEQILLKDPTKTVIVVNHSETEENKKLFDEVINLMPSK